VNADPNAWLAAGAADTVGQDLLELGAVFFGLGLLGIVAHRFGLSPVPLYLVAGLAFGDHGPLPLAAGERFIDIGAEVGGVLLLLSLGLEYSATELVAGVRQQLPSGLVDLVLNATPGAALALLLGWGPVAAVALAGVTYASSSGIVAKLIADLGHLGNRETPVVLRLLVFEDLTMAVYLPILTALLLGQGWVSAATSMVVALGAVVASFFVALRFPQAISRMMFSPNDEVLLLRVLGLALLAAGFAQQLNASAAVAAFLVGLSLSGEIAEGAYTLLRPLRDLFAAVFFLFVGLRIDPATIPDVALLAGLLAVITAVTKIASGWWAGARSALSPRGRLRIGIALIPRGEFSIVIGGLAATTSVDARFGALAATYVLILAIAGPLAVRMAEQQLTAHRRRAVRSQRARRGGAVGPSAEREERNG
jgi:CPA2 family monovalent cation:H+ antiporter-2